MEVSYTLTWNCGSRLTPLSDVQPFDLHLQLEAEAYLCPVRALADWLRVSEIKKGYLFRKTDSSDRVTEKLTVSCTHCDASFLTSSV